MATTKRNPITRKFATDYAIALITDTELPSLPAGTTTDDVVTVLTKMSNSFGTKKRDTNKPTAAQVENEEIFKAVVQFMSTKSEGVTAKEVYEHGVIGITSAQKASAVMRFAESKGYVHGNKTGKNTPIVYTLV